MSVARQPKTLHFEEEFEPSEVFAEENYLHQTHHTRGGATNSTYEGPVGTYSLNDELPIQLVKMRPNGNIELDEGALQLISMYNKPVGFVCLAGKYRTGKSFLLNKLLNLQGKGFKVDSSTTACTQGIWMWSKPLYNETHDCYLFFLDTEGSDSTNRNQDHDAKVFSLAILISSYFIYNSVGAIDETSINQLNLVTSLSKNIVVGSGGQQALHHYMPKFMWLLRDFVLQIRDERGRKLTPNEYLENSLLEQNNQIRESQSTRSIRRALLNYFKDRDCMMLVRPAAEEQDLKILASLPNSRLRRQFLDGVSQLKSKIMNTASPKVIGGQPINSLIFAELLATYVDAINKGGIPNISSAWQQVTQQASAQAYNAAIDTYNQLYSQFFAVDEPKGEQIYSILKDMHDKALITFDSMIEAPNERFRSKLKNFIFDKQRAIININNDLNQVRNADLLRQFSAPLIKNVQMGKYTVENPNALATDLNDMINNYNQNAKGPQKCEILSKFLLTFNPLMLKSCTAKATARVITDDRNTEHLKSQMQQMDRLNKMMEEQLNTEKKRNQQLSKDVSTIDKTTLEKNRLKEEVVKLRRELEQRSIKDNKKTKCCSIF